MAGVSNVTGDSGTSMSLVDYLSESQKETSSILDTSTANAYASKTLEDSATAKRRANNAYGSGATSAIGQAALKKAISEMQATTDGTITFTKIAAYQKQLEEQFTAKVRVDLVGKGVPLDVDFTLTLSSEGKVQVDCENAAAKEKIQKYLADNKKVGEQFGYIQALANLDRAKQSPAGASAAWQELRNAKANIQAQAVEMFFSDAMSSGMNYSSVLANFAGSSTAAAPAASFYAGVDYTV